MVDSRVILGAIAGGAILLAAGAAVFMASGSKDSDVSAPEEPYMGDSEYYTRGGKTKKRSRKHKKKTIRKNK